MKPSLLLAFSCLILKASAGGLAGGYDRVMLWYAFEIDRLGTTRSIATGCPEPCRFKQFMEYIDNQSTGYPEILDNPNDRRPEIHDTAERLLDQGWVPEKFRNVGRIITTADGSYNKMIEHVGIVISRATPAVRQANPDLFNNAVDAAFNAKDIRFVEWSRLNQDNLQRGTGLSLSYTESPTGHGTFFNIEKTMSNPKNLALGTREQLSTWIQDEVSRSIQDDPAARGHWETLVSHSRNIDSQQGGLCRNTS